MGDCSKYNANSSYALYDSYRNDTNSPCFYLFIEDTLLIHCILWMNFFWMDDRNEWVLYIGKRIRSANSIQINIFIWFDYELMY